MKLSGIDAVVVRFRLQTDAERNIELPPRAGPFIMNAVHPALGHKAEMSRINCPSII